MTTWTAAGRARCEAGARRRAFARLGAVHVLFDNAGIAVGGPILEMKHADWQWIIDVDLWGPIPGALATKQLCIVPHGESRDSVCRRFERIDRCLE